MNFKKITTGIACMLTALSVSAQTTDAEQVVAPDAPKKAKYANNILAISPIQLSENGVAGFGVSYEHSLDKAGIISFYLPVSVVMNTNSEQRLGSDAHYNDPMVYIMPGIKLYPTGNQGIAKYAVGPSLVFATGQRTEIDNSSLMYYTNNYIYPYGQYYPPNLYVTRTHTMLGMIVNQSLNINPTPHLYVGTELGLGFTYLNNMDGVSTGTTGLVQFSFKMGYRF